MGRRSKKPSATKKRVRSDKKAGVRKKTQPTSSNAKEPSANDYLEQAEKSMENFQIELAEKFCRRALQVDPRNVEALEMTATVLQELGQSEEARQLLQHAIELEPDTGHAKYLALGQTLAGREAFECLRKGVTIMERDFERAAASSSSSGSLSGLEVSNGFCALAELFLTDLCDEPNAEKSCEEYCARALQFEPNNSDALQLKASFMLSAGKSPDEARECMKKSVGLWLGRRDDDDDDEASGRDENLVPSYSSRRSAVKILLELEEFELASRVIESLLDDDDEVIEVWYLGGWMYHLMGDEHRAESVAHLKRAKELGEKLGCDDVDMMQHVDELLGEIEEESEEEEEEEEDVNDDDNDEDEMDTQ